MPQSTMAYVISTVSGMLRSIIVPDYDEQLLKPGWTLPGETLLIVPLGPTDIPSALHQVEAITGKRPADPRCAVVANGVVVDVINADPAIDVLPSALLVSTPAAGGPPVDIGWTYSPGTGFRPPVAAVIA
jgi:hypothetical protein